MSEDQKTMADHFLPDYPDWGEPTAEIEKLLEIPVRRVQREFLYRDPPFFVFGCTWHHGNSKGVLTEERFQQDLRGAIADFAREMNHYEEFLAYPITHKPPVVQGVAYHDWTGAIYPFDIRAVITLDESIPVDGETVEAGLTFNLLTLISKEVKQRCH